MGLKTTNYEVKDYGITLDTAYARISNIHIDLDGTAYCTFEIQKDRESIGKDRCFEAKTFECAIDKTLPIYEQVYMAAKKTLFADWEDDIIEE